MKMKFFFAALALVALASCTSDDFIGDVTTPQDNSPSESNAIVFNSVSKGSTRADYYGADAAAKLNNKFIVGGFKGALGTSTAFNSETGAITTQGVPATGIVFDNYIVSWEQNTAGKTESNTSDWEYVGIVAADPSGIKGNNQSIKYWDFSTAQYDFIAYSTSDASVITSGTPSGTQVLVSAINAANASSAAYTLKGGIDALKKCYIADMVTVYKDGSGKLKYRDEIPFIFRSLSSKVRIALYETIPGYSVKGVKFYTSGTQGIATATETKATLFTTGTSDKDNFYSSGQYSVYYPTIGKSNIEKSDYNKAHMSFVADDGGKGTTKDFSTLNYIGTKDHKEKSDGTIWLGRSSAAPSFAGAVADDYYQIVLPNEEGTVLELRIDYTLESIDGSGEEIHVYGAKAFVPLIYAQWKSGYAYTYLFKISDNTNGWTSQTTTDPAGLYPITFDAVVLESEDYTQSTITTVSTPSITTYQKGHNYTDGPEYKAGTENIYVQVMMDDVLKGDLGTNGQLYTITPRSGKTISEADVMDALNIKESEGSGVITGRNDWVLTEATSAADITAIPGADGNNITVTAGQAASFGAAAGTYAYVYDTQTYGGDYYPTKPAGWPTGYYTDAKCSSAASSTFSAGTYYRMESTIYTAVKMTSTTAPTDWDTLWFKDPNGVTPVDAWTETNNGKVFYKKYTVNKKIYGVKVIKVVN